LITLDLDYGDIDINLDEYWYLRFYDPFYDPIEDLMDSESDVKNEEIILSTDDFQKP
jgi:hypothetical protein